MPYIPAAGVGRAGGTAGGIHRPCLPFAKHRLLLRRAAVVECLFPSRGTASPCSLLSDSCRSSCSSSCSASCGSGHGLPEQAGVLTGLEKPLGLLSQLPDPFPGDSQLPGELC